MNIYHLNCASFCPLSAKLFNGQGRLWGRGRLISHCLLVKSSLGLILIDTGFGLHDVRYPYQLGKNFLRLFKPRLDPEETAVVRLQKLGYKPEDVKHIILTNLGLEKDGGLKDFPQAKVHVFEKEFQHAMERRTLRERLRYLPAHWSHHPDWVLHRLSRPSQKWFGFDSIRLFHDTATEKNEEDIPDILLIPLPGHTAGHCGVAIRSKKRWLFHCGNAYFSHKQMDKENPSCPNGLSLLQEGLDNNHGLRRHTQERLRSLLYHHKNEVQMFCSSDPTELAKLIKMRLD